MRELKKRLGLSGNQKSDKGFTLIEIMVVMAFIAIIGGFGLIYGLDSIQRSSFYSERDLLITALQHARSFAVGNTCLGSGCTDGRPHGVAIRPSDNPNSYVVFEGADYATRDTSADQAMPANASISHSGSAEVVFSQLSATSTGGTITLSDSVGHSTDITIGTEGQILWTK